MQVLSWLAVTLGLIYPFQARATPLDDQTNVRGNSGSITVEAAADGADRVDFLIDGSVFFSDYSAPFSTTLYSPQYPNGHHVLEVIAWRGSLAYRLRFPSAESPEGSQIFTINLFNTRLVAGHQHTCAVRGGRAYCWGSNSHGQLGNKAGSFSVYPVRVAGFLQSEVIQVAAGAAHSCALLRGGAVYCWGQNQFGQLGIGSASSKNVTLPRAVIGLYSGITAIEAGAHHTCAVTEKGEMKCWGKNQSGQLGTGDRIDSPYPVFVRYLPYFVEAMALGVSHTCATVNATPGQVSSYGRQILCWGDNTQGQLGIGSATLSLYPAAVSFPPSATRPFVISAGAAHSCTQLEDDTLWCWGRNSSGQLGNGFQANVSSPQWISGGTGISPMNGGFAHTCGIDGWGARCWGDNSYGQLGNGSTSPHSTPAEEVLSAIGPIETVISATQGNSHSCALTSRDIYCWGKNDVGQLGNNTTENQTIATRIHLNP